MSGKLNSVALRVSTPDAVKVDCTVRVEKATHMSEVIAAVKAAR